MGLYDDIVNSIENLSPNQVLKAILAQLQIQNKAKGAPVYYLSDAITLDPTTTSANPQTVATFNMPPHGVPYLDTVAIGYDQNAQGYFVWKLTIDGITDLNGNYKSFYVFANEVNPFVDKSIPLPTGAAVTLSAYCNGQSGAVAGTCTLYVLANVVS